MGSRSILITTLIIIILLLSGSLYWVYTKYESKKIELQNETQNRIALGDSVRVSKTREGDLLYSKAILIADVKNLKDLNVELANRVNNLGGRVVELTTTIISLEGELSTIKNNTLVSNGDDTYGIEWELSRDYGDDNKRVLSGITNFGVTQNPFKITPLNTVITRDFQTISITQGIILKNGVYEAFATSKFPGVSFTEIDSAIVEPDIHPITKKAIKKFNLGGYIGYGGTYDAVSNTFHTGFQLGAGALFKFF